MPDENAAAGAASRTALLLERARGGCADDPRVLGLLQHGSSATGEFDEFSDLDLTCIVRDDSWAGVRANSTDVVRAWGELIVARPVPLPDGGEVLFCQFDPGFVRADVVFRRMGDLLAAKERPRVLFDGSGGFLTERLDKLQIGWPVADPDDIDAGFWLDAEQIVRRLGRGELFDALSLIDALRARFLGPMLLRRAGRVPNGLRRIEKTPAASELLPTLAAYNREDCCRALESCIALYRRLRSDQPPVRELARMEAEIDARLRNLRH